MARKDADEPPDEALLVRGGAMGAESLAISAEKHWEAHGRTERGLSFWTDPSRDCDAVEIARRVTALCATEGRPHPIPHPAKMRYATAGAVRRLGYTVMYSEPRPMHVTVILPSPPSGTDWAALR